ncbi:hypothetical protein PGT21_018543 [Puccinia graminis f. sp. tritici]|uniref:Uncharacterized protein n=1 Tax=Puccinia graminis f. sp. tritici TaxID=56615 RepID=A0A5B0LJ45_PUCGR|nr:hypothetical protein PGT21_018543 [Puccinia graminis f. sp. tritici]
MASTSETNSLLIGSSSTFRCPVAGGHAPWGSRVEKLSGSIEELSGLIWPNASKKKRSVWVATLKRDCRGSVKVSQQSSVMRL